MHASNPLRRLDFLRVAALVVLAGTALTACRQLRADDGACSPVRDDDQVWLISQRGLGCDPARHVEKLQYWRYDPRQGWARSTAADFYGDDSDLPTTFFIHGNRVTSQEAFSTGLAAYRALVRCADPPPLRFVVWSWPSEPIQGPVEDARVKAARTNAAGYYLAWCIDRLPGDAPLGLWGYSFGARIATGALHLLGGGVLAGRRLESPIHPDRGHVQVALMAAALDNHWLFRGHSHGDALSQVDHLLLVNNSCDAVLQRYHRLYHRRGCQQALGYSGLAVGWLEAGQSPKIEQVDACGQIGRQHSFENYLCQSYLMARLRRSLLPTRSDASAGDSLAAVDESPAPQRADKRRAVWP